MRKGTSFRSNATEVELRREVTGREVGKRASALVFQMKPIAGDVRMALGIGKLMEPDGAARAIQVTHDLLAPDAFGRCPPEHGGFFALRADDPDNG